MVCQLNVAADLTMIVTISISLEAIKQLLPTCFLHQAAND